MMSRARVEVYFFTLLFGLILVAGAAKGQNITKRIRVVSGGSVSIIFNTIKDYSNGKVLTNWSRLYIYFIDTVSNSPLPPGDGASTGWTVLVRANQSALTSDDGSLTLPLGSVQIIPSTTIPGAAVYSPITLTDSDQAIVTGADPGSTSIDGEIVLSFDCGTVTPLLGKPPEFYSADLVFTIKELP